MTAHELAKKLLEGPDVEVITPGSNDNSGFNCPVIGLIYRPRFLRHNGLDQLIVELVEGKPYCFQR